MEAHKEGMRRLTVEMPASLHAQFKTEVSRQGLDIRAVVIPLVKSWLSGDSKIKIQPLEPAKVGWSQTINPEAEGWTKSIEKLVNDIVKKHLDQKEKEAEKSPEVHTVEKPESEELEEPESKDLEENEELVLVEEVEEAAELEEAEPEQEKPAKKKRKKKTVGIWPWTTEIDDEEEEKK